ncbi:hypothetical protein N9B34_02220, partial [Akkermansiaceae bacterium]|nr:hypothetical protein [Akkermansiaceae bacterium]
MARSNKPRLKEIELEPFEDQEDYDSGSASSRERVRQLVMDLLGRWYWIALGLILGVLGGLYYLSKAPKIYQATSTLLVKQGASSVISSDQVEDMDLRSADGLNTVAQRVERLELLTRLADLPEIQQTEGLVPDTTNWFPEWSEGWLGGGDDPSNKKPETSAELGRTIGKWLEVAVRRKTRLLDLTIAHPSPEIAQKLADTLAREYIAELSGDRSDGRNSSSAILKTQSEAARLKLQTAQNAQANYQQILETLKDLEVKEVVFSDLDRRYLPPHPKHMAAKATLDEYQKRFLSEFDLVRNATADKDYWESNRAEWDQTDLDVTSRLQIARRLLTARATVLKSEIESQNEVFNTVLTKMQETEIDQKAKEAEVELSSLSEFPENPASPKTMTVLAGSTLFGVGLGVSLAFLLVKLDNKIHTVIQAELLTKLPVLATIRDVQPKILAEIIADKGKPKSPVSPAAQKWDPRIVFRHGLTES